MKIAIHNSQRGFHPHWVNYCEQNNIPYKRVNCYANDIIDQLKDCDALMWHFHHASAKDVKFAKQLLYSVQAAGKKVFPDFNTMWHFDDKLGQKYLLEAIGAPLVPTYVFYTKQDALHWAKQTTWPKVFKLRGGAGSQNVRLVKTRGQAIKLIKKAFGKGFSQYNAWGSLKERWQKYRLQQTGLISILKGLVRIGYPTRFSKTVGQEKGYVYFQDYVPNNDHDIRIIVIDGKAFGLKRYVRKNDFRASGSGIFGYKREEFDERCVRIAFDLTEKIKSQSAAYDFIFDRENNPLLLEVSYGFVKEVYDPCTGYWDKDLRWHDAPFNPYGWMVNLLVNKNKKL